MNARSVPLHACLGWWLFCWVLALGLALIPTGPAYADHCEDEPWNLADCLRTKGYREVYVEILLAGGVAPTLISQILSEASKSSLTDKDLNRFIREQMLSRVNKWLSTGAARKMGGDLASKTSQILDNWEKDVTIDAQAPPQPQQPTEPPVEDIYDYSPGTVVSGEAARRFLEGTGALDKIARLGKTSSWDDKIRSMEGDPGKTSITDFSIPWDDDGNPDLNNLVFVMPDNAPLVSLPDDTLPPEQEEEPEEEPESEEKPEQKKKPKTGKVPPQVKKEPQPVKEPPKPKEEKPQDLKDRFERFRKDRDEAAQRALKLTLEGVELLKKLKQTELEWNVSKLKAVTDGVVDILDIMSDVVDVKSLATKTFGGAYLKDFAKTLIKEGIGQMIRDGYAPGGLQDVDPTQLVIDPVGFKMKDMMDPLQKMRNTVKNPIEVIDLIPGGGLKQVIQNVLEKSGRETASKIYGPGETAIKGFKDAREKAIECENLRAEMSKINQRLTQVKNELQESSDAYELADNSIRRTRANMDELKEMFPNRFRHY